jgi:molybdopterin-containing oxidoreductase family membrane subunit
MAEMKHANVACALAFVGIWIEKGMGLIIPGFLPSTLHEWVEYIPSAAEWKIMAGIWASGLIVYTLLLKVAIPVFTGNVSGRRAK